MNPRSIRCLVQLAILPRFPSLFRLSPGRRARRSSEEISIHSHICVSKISISVELVSELHFQETPSVGAHLYQAYEEPSFR